MEQSRGHILWVDDEIHHLKPHILSLEEKGYKITQATNGQDAVALVKKNTFALVLLDQSMPGMDGLGTLAEIRKINSSLPIIMITKTEDEWLMDDFHLRHRSGISIWIGNGISNYHIKIPQHQDLSWGERLKLRKALKELKEQLSSL